MCMRSADAWALHTAHPFHDTVMHSAVMTTTGRDGTHVMHSAATAAAHSISPRTRAPQKLVLTVIIICRRSLFGISPMYWRPAHARTLRLAACAPRVAPGDGPVRLLQQAPPGMLPASRAGLQTDPSMRSRECAPAAPAFMYRKSTRPYVAAMRLASSCGATRHSAQVALWAVRRASPDTRAAAQLRSKQVHLASACQAGQQWALKVRVNAQCKC